MRSIHRKVLVSFTLTGLLLLTAAFALAQDESEPVADNRAVPENTRAAAIKPAEPKTTTPADSLADKTPSSDLTKRIGVKPIQARSLTLNQAVLMALQNNNEIEVTRNDVKIAEATLRSLYGFYDPVFTVTPNYTNSVQPQPSTLGGADLSGVTRSKGFRVDSSFFQPLKTGGGDLTVFFNNNRNETSSSFSRLNPTYSTNFGVRFNQPLLRNRGVDNSRRLIRIQRKLIAQTDADFRRRTIEIISQVQRSYWDLVFALRDQQNRVANVNLTKENLRQVEARIKAGSSAPLKRAEVSTELANREADLLLASQQVSTAENALKQLLLRDPSSSDWSVSYTPTDTPVFSSDPIDLDSVMKDAIANRPEMQRLRLQKEINDIDLSYYKDRMKPQVDLNASYTMIGLSGASTQPSEPFTVPLISGDPSTSSSAFLLSELRQLNPNITVPDVTIVPSVPPQFIGGYGRSLSNLFKNDTRTYTIGVTISLPLRNKTAKADLASARFQKERIAAQTRSQEQTVIAEVRNAVQAVETARKRVLTSRRARENAEIQLNGERKLYDVGKSTTFLLFQRENALTNARNAEIRAETDYNKALADLQKAASTTLGVHDIKIVSPTKKPGT